MSFEQNFEYIGFNMMQKANENDMCFIMIYKPNENKKEKKDKMIKFKEGIDFLLDDEKEYTEDVIRIFGKYFVEQNKNKCKIIYNNKKYILKEYFDEIDNNYNPKIKEIKIKLNGINCISNMKEMFYGCYHLTSLSKSKNVGTKQIEIFNDDNSQASLFENESEMKIKEENINNLYINEDVFERYKEPNDLYYGNSLSALGPISTIESNFSSNYKKSLNLNIKTQSELSKNFSNIKNISFMFSGCISLISLPDLSEWDISNVIDMRAMFELCISLKSLPDISKWNTSNVTAMYHMFFGYKSLISLPDISKWNTSSVTDMSAMFIKCKSLISLPDISKWNT